MTNYLSLLLMGDDIKRWSQYSLSSTKLIQQIMKLLAEFSTHITLV
jgi:hypothetical protein